MAYKEIEDFGFTSLGLEDIAVKAPSDSDGCYVVDSDGFYVNSAEYIDTLKLDLKNLDQELAKERQRTTDVFERINVLLNSLIDAKEDYIFWPREERIRTIEQFRAELFGIILDKTISLPFKTVFLQFRSTDGFIEFAQLDSNSSDPQLNVLLISDSDGNLESSGRIKLWYLSDQEQEDSDQNA